MSSLSLRANVFRLMRDVRRAQWKSSLFPRDLVAYVGRCTQCEREAHALLTLTEPVYGASLERLRYRTAHEVLQTLSESVLRPPPLRVLDEPVEGETCVCGAPRTSRALECVRLFHAMVGTRSDVIVQGVCKNEAWHWSLLRFAIDGLEIELDCPADDASIRSEWRRDFTLAATWSSVHQGVLTVDASMCLANAADGAELRALLHAESNTAWWIERVDIEALTTRMWARELVLDWRTHHRVVGAAVHRATLHELLSVYARQQGNELEVSDEGEWFVRHHDVRWPIEPMAIARMAIESGLHPAEAAAIELDGVRGKLEQVHAFVCAVREARPTVEFVVLGTQLTVKRDGALSSRAISLLSTPFQVTIGTDALAREVRFLCDDVPSWVDPTRVCSCGASLMLVHRLVAWEMVEAAARARPSDPPSVLESWPATLPRSASVMALVCDRHVQLPSVHELRAAGYSGDSLLARVRGDAPFLQYNGTWWLTHDTAGRAVLFVSGNALATTLIDEAQLASLHLACGSPVTAKPRRVMAVGPHRVCVHDPAFDSLQLEQLVRQWVQIDGVGGGSFVVARTLRLEAQPLGRFHVRASETTLTALQVHQ